MRTIGLAALTLLALGGSSCGGTPTSPSANVPFSTTDIRVGTGTEATSGRSATVAYAGHLYSASAADNKGTPFDAGSFSFIVGSNQVIPGFSQGVQGMRVGGTRRVIIPPSLGYGSQASGPIPGNSTLVFDIELLAVQ